MKESHTHLYRGQSMVELAMLLPVLLILSFIALDLGRGIYYYSAVYNAAREGARYAIVHQCRRDQPLCYNTPQIAGLVEHTKKLTVGLGPTANNFYVTSVLTGTENSEVQVTVGYVFKLVTPLANLLPGNGRCGALHIGSGEFCLKSTSTMLIER